MKNQLNLLRLVRTPEAIVCVLAGLMLFLAVPAAGQQIAEVAGSTAADDAYQELSLKNYEAAIHEFQKALASDPSNADWRADLAYAELAAGSPKDAARDFETVYRDHPEELKIALELGYLYLQLNDNPAAKKYFSAAQSSVDPEISQPARQAMQDLRDSELQARKQKAYDLLDQGHREEALSLFEQAHIADPADSAVTLQLGYLYQDTGKMAKAREMFETERNNQDPKVSGQATAALKEVRRESAWWFASAYVAPFYESRFANQVNPIEFKVGLRLNRYVQPYLGMRFSRDIQSTSGTLPVIYSDNSNVFSVGLQSPILGHGTNLYAEAGTAVSLEGQPVQGRAVPDYRAGIIWYKPWQTSLAEASKTRSPNFSLTGNAYSDVSYYSRYADDVIGYLQIRQGVNLPTAHLLPMQVLAAINVVKDSNGDFYNNVLEAGPAWRIAPFRRLPSLQFEVDYLRGFYTAHDQANPYGPRYGDFRVFFIWSKDF
jgi:tetratricopeptide (TPR) repeat protein